MVSDSLKQMALIVTISGQVIHSLYTSIASQCLVVIGAAQWSHKMCLETGNAPVLLISRAAIGAGIPQTNASHKSSRETDSCPVHGPEVGLEHTFRSWDLR